jgi:hypothetical protein
MTTHFDSKLHKEGVKSGIYESFEFVVREPEKYIIAMLRKRGAIVKDIDQQIQIATNRAYRPVKYKWRSDFSGNIRQIAVPIRVKKWWTETLDGKVQISVYHKGKALEFKEGRNAIQVDSIKELKPSFELLQVAINLGDFDDLL